MAGLPHVIGLLHRADWTRLSLSAEVRFEQDGDLARRRQAVVWAELMRRIGIRPDLYGGPSAEQEPEDGRGGYHRWRAALLIAPGRRYRLEYGGDTAAGPTDLTASRAGGPAAGPGAAPAARLRGRPGAAGSGPVRPGRPARRVHPGRGRAGHRLRPRRDRRDRQAAARRRRVPDGPAPPGLSDRVELIVDAETGILLRREETFEGQVLTLTELTTVTMSPPEADDQAQFAPPAGSRPSRDAEEGSATERARLGGGEERRGPGGGRPRRLAPAGTAPARPPPGRRGRPRGRDATSGTGPARSRRRATTLRRPARLSTAAVVRRGLAPRGRRRRGAVVTNSAPSIAQVRGTIGAAGPRGVGYLLDAISRRRTVTRTTGRLRVGGPDLYYLDCSSWQAPARTGRDRLRRRAALAGPRERDPGRAGPADDGRLASMVGSSWLLGQRLSGGAEITYHGRRGYHLRVTRGDDAQRGGPSMFYPVDAIVDAETGFLLRLIAYDGDTPAAWWELDDVTAAAGGRRPGRIPPAHPARNPRLGGNRQPDSRCHRGHARPDRARGPRHRRCCPPHRWRRLRRPEVP